GGTLGVRSIEAAASTEGREGRVRREGGFDIRDLGVSYGSTQAISGVTLEIHRNIVTAIIGPSGCGKSTFIRCLNRMNELVPGVALTGKILYHGEHLYGPDADHVE